MGLTQINLAERLGVSFPTVNRWENAKTRPSQLSWNRLLALADEADSGCRVAEPEPTPCNGAQSGFDFTAQPDIVRSLIEGERLSFGHLANPAFATEIASIDPLPHQRIAVYDHMLKQARLRFLLADDAGAGKTIMTGLYIREMLSRRLLNRVLIVPPAGLVGNWQRELHLLFGLPFNGEPVFESFRELVRQKLGKEALRGAVFVDPTASKPYLFHVARLTVIRKADPEIPELAHEETLECRLVGVKQSESMELSTCPVEHLLLLRGGHGLPPQAQRMAVETHGQLNQAGAYLTERVCRSLAIACRKRIMASLPEREIFVHRRYDFQEAELAHARAKTTRKARTGNKGAAAELAHIKMKQRNLSNRLEQTLNIIRCEPELVVPGEPDPLACRTTPASIF